MKLFLSILPGAGIRQVTRFGAALVAVSFIMGVGNTAVARHPGYNCQAVVDATGIMGQVTAVSLFSAEAILITDTDHAVPVEVNRNGLRTVALGTGDIVRLELPFLPNNADIEVGDLLVTSGLGGTFPRGVSTSSKLTSMSKRRSFR